MQAVLRLNQILETHVDFKIPSTLNVSCRGEEVNLMSAMLQHGIYAKTSNTAVNLLCKCQER